MPIHPIVPILAIPAALGLGWGVVTVVQDQRAADEKKKKKKNGKKSTTAAAYAPNGVLGDAPEVMMSVVPPIELGNLGPVQVKLPSGGGDVTRVERLNLDTKGAFAEGVALTDPPRDVLAGLVTNLTPAATAKAWAELSKDITDTEGGTVFDEPSGSQERLVQQVLKVIAPEIDFSKGLSPYGANGKEAKLWAGVNLLGELRYQSVWNAYAKKQSGGGPTPSGPPKPGDGGGMPVDPTPDDADPVIEQQWKNYYARPELAKPLKGLRSMRWAPSGATLFAVRLHEDANGQVVGVVNYTGRGSGAGDGLYERRGTDPNEVWKNLMTFVQAKDADAQG